jgi:hypothetical protein
MVESVLTMIFKVLRAQEGLNEGEHKDCIDVVDPERVAG